MSGFAHGVLQKIDKGKQKDEYKILIGSLSKDYKRVNYFFDK
jgi:hypothetical protein